LVSLFKQQIVMESLQKAASSRRPEAFGRTPVSLGNYVPSPPISIPKDRESSQQESERIVEMLCNKSLLVMYKRLRSAGLRPTIDYSPADEYQKSAAHSAPLLQRSGGK